MRIERGDYTLMNASNRLGASRATSSEIVTLRAKVKNLERFCESVKIVALGQEAEWACRRAGLTAYTLPPPSGLNRQLNDKDWLLKQLMACKSWLQGEGDGKAA